MKYYVLEIVEGDSKVAGKGVYEYNDLTSATASFHSKMGVAMKSDLYKSELLMVIDENGMVPRFEKYEKPDITEE